MEERLKQLLEPEDEQESIKAAKAFLSDLGSAKFDDPSVAAKIREQAALLQVHVTGEELATVNALLAKLDALPLLEQAAHQMTTAVQKQIAQLLLWRPKILHSKVNSKTGEPSSPIVIRS